MRKLSVIILILSFSWCAQADLVGGAAPTVEDFDGSIIEDQLLSEVVFEEPFFGSRNYERDIASADLEELNGSDAEWQGQLVVLKEIPYSYAQLSRRTLQLRTLAEIEQEELVKKEQESVSQ